MIARADLVLTASNEHRSIVLEAEPLMMSRVFTLREFARLSELARLDQPTGLPTRAGMVARVASIARIRGTHRPTGPRENDIADPFGASLPTARAVVAEIAAAVDSTVAGLGLAPYSAAVEPDRSQSVAHVARKGASLRGIVRRSKPGSSRA